jgi:hypothetical protein
VYGSFLFEVRCVKSSIAKFTEATLSLENIDKFSNRLVYQVREYNQRTQPGNKIDITKAREGGQGVETDVKCDCNII